MTNEVKSRFALLEVGDIDTLEPGELTQGERREVAAALLEESAHLDEVLSDRLIAQEHLIDFCCYVDPQYLDVPHLRIIGEKLEQVERYVETQGDEGIGRLIITVPPRHGKSKTVSHLYPSFLLGRHPDWRIALVSYGATLAEDASRNNRAIVRDEPLYKTLFPDVELSPDSQAVARWSVAGQPAGNPSILAVGVGGPIVGRGFQVIVIDDPIKDRAEAESETIREKLKAWYRGTLRTRLETGGAIVIIQTRWHEDDLVGWLLEQEKIGEGEDWDSINLPALAETKDVKGNPIEDPLGRSEGAALWSDRFGQDILLQTKKAVGSYDWESQFQGHPKPPEGSKILREWLQVIPPNKVPKDLRWVRYWDLAISTKETASYTASARLAMDDDSNLYVASMIRGRWEWPQQKRVIATTMIAEKPLGVEHGVESAVHGTAAVQTLRKIKELRGIALRSIHVSVDKLTRALPWIALAEAGHVFLVAGPWVGDFIDEAAAFTGKNDLYDDQIDTLSGGSAMLAKHGMETAGNPFYG
jgi:predicted phage terminase large subunit-like protein